MNKVDKQFFKCFTSSIEYKVILLYLFLGAIFTPVDNSLDYITMFYSIISNKLFLIIFLYPSLIAMIYIFYNYTSNNSSILIRLESKKNFISYSLFNIFIQVLFLYIQVLIILLIVCNITLNQGFLITKDIYNNTYNWIVLIILIFKCFLNLCIIGFFGNYIRLKFSYKTSFIILFSFLLLMFFGARFYPTGHILIDVFNPGFHSCGYSYEHNILKLIFSSLIYYIIVIPILIVENYKIVKKINIGVN